jgi:hypothetical protein
MATISSTAFPKLESVGAFDKEKKDTRSIEETSQGLTQFHRELLGRISKELYRQGCPCLFAYLSKGYNGDERDAESSDGTPV